MIQAEVRSIREGREHVRAEVTWKTTNTASGQHLHVSVISLTSASSKRDVVKSLGQRLPDIDFEQAVEQLAALTLKEHRRGSPPLLLQTDGDTAVEIPKVIEPYFHDRLPFVIYGPPDTGKSLVMLTIAAVAVTGSSLPGLPFVAKQRMRPLYLDWESSPQDIASRLARLEVGLQQHLGGLISYRGCARSLANEQDELREHIADLEIDFVVIDSLGLAAGGDLNSPQSATEFFAALRNLDVTAGIIAHTSKSNESARRTIFGSMFFEALARGTAEIRRHFSPNPDELLIELLHRKCNTGRRVAPIALGFRFSQRGLVIEPRDPDELRGDSNGGTVADRVKEYIAENGPSLPREIEAATGIKGSTLRKTLQRLVDWRLGVRSCLLTFRGALETHRASFLPA